MKTNAVRLLEEMGVRHELRAYDVDPDDLSAETLARFAGTRVPTLDAATLRTALAASLRALLREGEDARLPHAPVVAERLADLQEYPSSP